MKNKLFLIICFLYVGIIAFNSSQVSSKSNYYSYKITDSVTRYISKTDVGRTITKKYTRVQINIFIRKIAHVCEFAVLAFLLSMAFNYFELRNRDILIYTLFIVLFVGVLDEFFQLYVTQRTSSVRDVLIDFAGGIFAEIIFFMFLDSKRSRH